LLHGLRCGGGRERIGTPVEAEDVACGQRGWAGSNDRSSRGDLDACHTSGVERDPPIAVAAAQDPGVLTEHLDDLVDHLVLIDLIGVFKGKVRMVPADEPDPQHDSCHARR
jgi:hypothetical protein